MRFTSPLKLTVLSFLALAAPAGATVSAAPLSGAHFAYVSREVGDGRCSDGIGVQFAPVPVATSYNVDYFDGYYQSEAGGIRTVAELLQDQASTPSALYYGITGGTGPDPCNGEATGGGRFTKPPTVTPIYPDGKNPPLAAHHSKSSRKGAGTVTIEAAAGTFPIDAQPYVDVVIKAGSKPLSNITYGNGLRYGSLTESVQGYPPVVLAKHASTTLSFFTDTKKAGSLPLSLAIKAKVGKGKKAKKVKITGTSAIRFG